MPRFTNKHYHLWSFHTLPFVLPALSSRLCLHRGGECCDEQKTQYPINDTTYFVHSKHDELVIHIEYKYIS